MLKKIPVLIILFIVALACQSRVKQGKSEPSTIIYTAQDSLILTDLLNQFSEEKEKPTALLVEEIGKTFLGIPYVSGTLENGKAENLVVNLRELDCTTFAENCLAIARTIKSGNSSFAGFANELEQIRYRNGKRDGYPSRLHYFSDWIRNNRDKNLVTEPAEAFSSPVEFTVNFMSTHPDSYEVLKEDSKLIPVIAGQEQEISSRDYFYLKKEDVAANEDKLREGDIVGITTTIKGLDVAHVGILVKVDGRIHLMHASSALEKVIISEEPLADQLMNKKSYTGIMIARPE